MRYNTKRSLHAFRNLFRQNAERFQPPEKSQPADWSLKHERRIRIWIGFVHAVESTFEKIDELEYEGNRYVALIPYYESEEDALEDDGEFIVLMESEEDGETFFVTVDSEEDYDKIGSMFAERIQDLFDFDEDAEEE